MSGFSKRPLSDSGGRQFTVRRAGQATVLAVLALGVAGVIAAVPANAAGTSSSAYNCYTQWWNTAWAQKCGSGGADKFGTYESKADCNNESDKYLTKLRNQGSTAVYSGSDCSFKVNSGSIIYYF